MSHNFSKKIRHYNKSCKNDTCHLGHTGEVAMHGSGFEGHGMMKILQKYDSFLWNELAVTL
jgi:hypothetical protein